MNHTGTRPTNPRKVIMMKKQLGHWAISRISSFIPRKTWSYFWSGTQPLEFSDRQARFPEINVSKPTPLCGIMNQFGSDKGSGWLNYTRVYHAIFSGLHVRSVFEMGIGTTDPSIQYNMGTAGRPGASLFGWRSFFPEAAIVSADIDKTILVQSDRITSYPCDQTSPESILNLWRQPEIPQTFDVMIDDGLHEFNANCTLFENSIQKLRAGGIYVVEDIKSIELGDWRHKIEKDYVKRYPSLVFRLTLLPNLTNVCDNNLLMVYKPNDT